MPVTRREQPSADAPDTPSTEADRMRTGVETGRKGGLTGTQDGHEQGGNGQQQSHRARILAEPVALRTWSGTNGVNPRG